MAKVQTKKINVNDFSIEARADISKLARSLNPFFDDVERALRKGLTVDDNLPFQYLAFTAEVDGSGTPKQKINLGFNLTNLKGCVIINAKANNNTSYPTAAPFASYTTVGSVLSITNIAGLPANTPFAITILLMA